MIAFVCFFPLWIFKCVLKLPKKIQLRSCIGCSCLARLRCVSSNCQYKKIYRIFIITLVAFVWLFSTMCFQMFHKNVCRWRFIVTLIAFVWLFSMCVFKCIFRAFVWLFIIVFFFQICQIYNIYHNMQHLIPNTLYKKGMSRKTQKFATKLAWCRQTKHLMKSSG